MALTPRDRRALIALGIVGALALVLFLVILPKGGGGAGPPIVGVPPTSPSPTPRTSPLPGQIVFGGRDPFEPLVVAGSGGGGPSQTTSPTSTSTSSPTPSPTSTSGGTGTTVSGHHVTLVDIFTDQGVTKVQVEVDGTVYTIRVGESFANGFTLESVSGTCATFTFHQQEFTLCENPQK